jgi:hypothetical protein
VHEDAVVAAVVVVLFRVLGQLFFKGQDGGAARRRILTMGCEMWVGELMSRMESGGRAFMDSARASVRKRSEREVTRPSQVDVGREVKILKRRS